MKVGVIGAGTMGQGIAKAFAQVEGNTVALCDIKQEWAENGLAKIKKGYDKLVAKGKMTQEKADAIVAAITPGLKEDLCADCDLIVEAAFEDMKVKQTTFGELDKICKPECIFASNTSSLSITEIGKGLSRPMIGMHFFNPADRMKLVEVIAGVNTPVETVDAIKKIADEGPCILVGRCADYALESYPNVVSVFIHADLDARIRRIARLYNLTDAKAKDTIVKADKKRASYYNYYTNKKWSDSASYELCLNSSELGIEGTAKAIEQYVQLKESIQNEQRTI